MDLTEFRRALSSGQTIMGGSEVYAKMQECNQRAMRITCELNGSYHEPAEVRRLFFELIDQPLDETFIMFPPFHTDCGLNTTVGRRVFMNSCCSFQDQGGIVIGDDTLIGHNVTMCTLNHETAPDRRANLRPGRIVLGKQVWVGANATILPGVTVGDGAMIAAGAVVNRDVPAMSLVGGVPAKFIKWIESTPRE